MMMMMWLDVFAVRVCFLPKSMPECPTLIKNHDVPGGLGLRERFLENSMLRGRTSNRTVVVILYEVLMCCAHHFFMCFGDACCC
jgi:hypothetical protein